MIKRSTFGILVGLVPLCVWSGAASAKDPSVSFEMISDAPPALERAADPYRACVTNWMGFNGGSYEEIVKKMDFRRGPAQCREQRHAAEEAGMIALGADMSESKCREMVRQELLTIDISIFSGLIWTSQSRPENQ